jgi:hypothetical protein
MNKVAKRIEAIKKKESKEGIELLGKGIRCKHWASFYL